MRRLRYDLHKSAPEQLAKHQINVCNIVLSLDISCQLKHRIQTKKYVKKCIHICFDTFLDNGLINSNY